MTDHRRLAPAPMIFPMPALLIGTYDEDGTPNAMTAGWASACAEKPPTVGVAVRASRQTHPNILARRAFTVNVARAADAALVDALGIISGRDEPQKLTRLEVETRRADEVEAPLLLRCPVVIECRLAGQHELGSHTFFFGEVVAVHVEVALLDGQDRIDVARLDPLVYCTSERQYRRLGASLGPAYTMGLTLRAPR